MLEDGEMMAVENIKIDEFVRRKVDSKKTYIRCEYCRYNKKYELRDFDDYNRSIYVKKGTMLHVGFTF